MGTVPDYNLRAINKYNSKFDRVAVNLPKGTKEKIKEITGKSCNAYINELVLADLARLEANATPAAVPAVIESQTTVSNAPITACESEQRENREVDKETPVNGENGVEQPPENYDSTIYAVRTRKVHEDFVEQFTPEMIKQLEIDANETDEHGNVTKKATEAGYQLERYRNALSIIAQINVFIESEKRKIIEQNEKTLDNSKEL